MAIFPFAPQHYSLFANVGAPPPTIPFDLQQNNLFAKVEALSPTILFALQHNVIFWKIRALSPTILFRLVGVPSFPAVMFSTDTGSFQSPGVLVV